MKSISNTMVAAAFALVLTLVVGALLHFSFGQGLEAWTGDKLLTWRYELDKNHKPDPRLVFVAIDQKTVTDLSERYPLPRGDHGTLLKDLAPEKPKVVTWDIFFTEYTANSRADDATQQPPPAPDTTNTPALPPANAPSTAPAPDATGTTPVNPAAATPADAPPATPPPAAPAPAAPAADAPDASPQLAQDDQDLINGAKVTPHMVTVAASDPQGKSVNNEDLGPTRPLTHIIGDPSQITAKDKVVLPIPELRQVSYFGFADFEADDNRRSVGMVINTDGKIFPSLSLQTLMQYWDVDPDKVVVDLGHEVTLPKPDGTAVHIPIDAAGHFLINYRAAESDFHGISYSDLGAGLEDKANNTPSDLSKMLPAIKDNIVVVGVTLSGTDNSSIPIASYSPLVVAQLNVLNNILQGDYLHRVSTWIWLPVYGLFLFVLGCVMLQVMALRYGIFRMAFIALGAMLGVGVVAFGALDYGSAQIPVAMPELGLLLLSIMVPSKGFFGEEREKQRVKSALRANVSEKVMIKMLEHPDNLKLGGTKRIITVMFCDIRNFTKYCDNRDSAEVMQVLNEYMEEMTQVVHKYDGTVDKYIGDCIMAFWNAPDDQPGHAQQAVCCAMEMRYALANFKTKRAGKDIELFECGIGIHTGEALVGMMGSSIKSGYTAMGSTVNLGARLEALTKRLNERILISQETRDQLQGEFPLTDRGEATVPGFANPVRVYAVGADQDISSALKVGRAIATQQEYTAEEVSKPIWEPAPLPEDADPNP